MELNERKYRILRAIIDDYILNAIPVGSRTLSQRAEIGLSSATIRNEMSSLEVLGYLDQPHTSAGRVPSYLAYRLYVDKIMQVYNLSPDEAMYIKRSFERRMGQIDEVLESAAEVLSDMSNYTSLVLTPKMRAPRFKHVQLVPLSATRALVIVVTDIGVLKDTIIRVPADVSPEYLSTLSNAISHELEGRTIADLPAVMNMIKSDMLSHREFFESLMGHIRGNITAASGENVIVGGQSKLLNFPEFADIEKAKAVFSALERKDTLYDILSSKMNMEFSISIGPENSVFGGEGVSLVTMSYRLGDGLTGTMGIFGPTRMDYARVVAVLRHMQRAINAALDDND